MLLKKNILFSLSFILISLLYGCRQKTTIQTTSTTELTTVISEPLETTSLSVDSPNKNIRVMFELDLNGAPMYSLIYKGETLINPSSLGFNLKDQNPLRDDFKIVNYTTDEFNETWEPVWGEKSVIKNHYNELTIELEEKNDNPRKMNVIFRVFDNGIGFRYVIPEQEHLNAIQIMSENTEFRFTSDHTAWWIPNDWDSYEYLYRETPLSEVREVSTPLTMKTKEGVYLTLHEAALIDYAGMALKKGVGNTLISSLCPWPDGVKVKGYTPLTTPWRTIEIGDDAGDLVESDLILNLNEPNQIENTSWIEPMKYVGIWWEMHIDQSTWSSGSRHGATTENAKRYIDFAYEHLESENQPIGLLVEGWNVGWDGNWMDNGHLFDFTTAYPDFDLEEVVQYGMERGISYIAHNETSGDIVNYEEQLKKAYAYYQSLGIHAIKSGYVADSGMKDPLGQHHHGQYMVNHYNNAVKLAAEYEIMINTHEPIKDTGLTRTYPNWVSREGVQGMEYNAWSEGNPPDHTTILPFTRMMAGPIDYTPGIFDVNIESKQNNRVHTTRAKQLALYVTISSPIQMVTDIPENYLDENGNIYPEFKFIKDVPTTWDQIIVPHAEIGDFVTIVRQSGEDWYIGSITDENARDLEIELNFLDPNKRYVAEIYQDGLDADWVTNPNTVSIQKVIVESSDTLIASLASSGGQAVRLYPATEQDIINLPNYQKPTIEVSYLTVPNEILSNESLELNLRARNNGHVFASKDINLIIDGTTVLTKNIRLAPNSTKDITVSYDDIFEPKSLSVTVNDHPTFNVEVKTRESTFNYSNLNVSMDNKTVTISGVVINLGTYEGSEQVKLIVNGEIAEIKTITLGAKSGGMSQTVSFQYEITQDGIYEFSMGDLPAKIITYPQIELNNWLFHPGDDLNWKETSFDDQSWETVFLPSKWESHSNYYDDNCYGWYRKELIIPANWQGYSLKLTLGKIDDVDQTYFNGQLIGQSGMFPDEQGGGMQTAWEEVREYMIPKELIQFGDSNIISIRIFDGVVDGGLYEGPISIELIK